MAGMGGALQGAGQGAAAGSVAGPWGAVIGAGVGVLGSMMSSDAAGDAANAQAAMAAQTRDAILGYSKTAGNNALDLSAASPQELNALGNSYSAAYQGLQQQQKLFAAIDPALMEASKQALTILRGGQAQMNQPMMDVRNQQRSQLINSLKANYGPGAETTQAGMQALSNFDMQTQSMFQQNQQNSLGQLMGIANNPNSGAGLDRSTSVMGNVAGQYGALQQRQANTQLNVMNSTLGALAGSSQQMINTAGSQYVGQGLMGQGLSSLGNLGMQIGGNMMGRSAGGFTPNNGNNGMATNPAAGWQPNNPFNGSNPFSAAS